MIAGGIGRRARDQLVKLANGLAAGSQVIRLADGQRARSVSRYLVCVVDQLRLHGESFRQFLQVISSSSTRV
jgi:hypothetical protein